MKSRLLHCDSRILAAQLWQLAITSVDYSTNMEVDFVISQNTLQHFWTLMKVSSSKHRITKFQPAITIFRWRFLHIQGFDGRKFSKEFPVCVDSSRAISDFCGFLENAYRTSATFSSERDVDGLPLLYMSVTDPLVISFV